METTGIVVFFEVFKRSSKEGIAMLRLLIAKLLPLLRSLVVHLLVESMRTDHGTYSSFPSAPNSLMGHTWAHKGFLGVRGGVLLWVCRHLSDLWPTSKYLDW